MFPFGGQRCLLEITRTIFESSSILWFFDSLFTRNILLTEGDFHAAFYLSVKDNEQKYYKLQTACYEFKWIPIDQFLLIWRHSYSFCVNSKYDKNQFLALALQYSSREGKDTLWDTVRLRKLMCLYYHSPKKKKTCSDSSSCHSSFHDRGVNAGFLTCIWKWRVSAPEYGSLRLSHLLYKVSGNVCFLFAKCYRVQSQLPLLPLNNLLLRQIEEMGDWDF